MNFLLEREIFFASVAIAVAMLRYALYFISIFCGSCKPHVFSWFNWGLMVGIGAAAQFQANGGLSAWVLVVVSTMCLVISALALVYGEKNITRGDWVAFVGTLIVIPIWAMSQNPYLTFFLLAIIDVLSYYPTWRKMWLDPWSEPTSGFFWSGLRYFLAMFAVPEFTLGALVYPIWLMLSDWGTGVYMVARRRMVRKRA